MSNGTTLSPLAKSDRHHIVLPDLIPPDLLIILIEHLISQGALKTLSRLQQTSKTNYDLITPFLNRTRTLNTGSLTFDTLYKEENGASVEAIEQKAKNDGWLYQRKGAYSRQKIQWTFIKHLIVDKLPQEAAFQPPSKSYPTPSSPPLRNVETVTICPGVLHDLSLYFSAWISENFLRPLSNSCQPTTLILIHPNDTALGSYKHLMNLLDELRWPSLTRLVIKNVGAHALPSRPGLDTTITFEDKVPVKWEVKDSIPFERRLEKYEKSRLTQILMAIPRSVRIREGGAGLDDTRWRFVGAARFFGMGEYLEASTERLRDSVRDWAEREYGAAGWHPEEVEELCKRIEFLP